MTSPSSQSNIVKGQTVGMVSNYKYLGTMIDNRLKFNWNTEMLWRKANNDSFASENLPDSRLIRPYWHFSIELLLSLLFHLLFFAGMATLLLERRMPLQRLWRFSSLNHIYNNQVLNKAMAIRSECALLFSSEYKVLTSGLCLSAPISSKKVQKFFHPCLHSSHECW